MEFRLVHEFESLPAPIGYRHTLLVAGSCFAEHIGNRLAQHKFNVLVNPGGILFNPISILHNLRSGLEPFSADDHQLVQQQGLWQSWNHHGSFGSANKEELVNNLQQQHHLLQLQLSKAEYLLITFGSAHVFELKSTGQVVANCHKVPSSQFRQRRLTVEEIVEAWSPLLRRIHSEHPHLKMIWTVSPVKYLSNGLQENNLSKATLLLAVEALQHVVPHSYYFPAYELVNDELRDYRFYAEDMAHPSAQAIDYVWEKFKAHCIGQEDLILLNKIAALQTSMQHRTLHPDAPAHQQFLASQLKQTQQLQQQHPQLNWEAELAYFSKGQ